MDRANASIDLIAPDVRTSGDGIRFAVATIAHDAAIRRLLRDTPFPGQISVSMEHEPSHFAAASIHGAGHQTIIATKDDRVICTGTISARQRFVNGRPTRVGYLSGLRLDASCRGCTSIIRRGYGLMRELHERDGPMIYLTSIVSDNLPARRLFERGLRDMPVYHFLGEFVTLVIRRENFAKPSDRHPQVMSAFGSRSSFDYVPAAVIELLNRWNRLHQFAPVWSATEIAAMGLTNDDFRFVYDSHGSPVACAALWDQRRTRQIVVRGYGPRLRKLRPMINLLSGAFRRPRLPEIGETVASAFISHLAADPDDPKMAGDMIRLLCPAEKGSKIDYLTIGLDARDPRLPYLQEAFRPREYRSRLYAVHWDDGTKLVADLDDRLLAPEVAIL